MWQLCICIGSIIEGRMTYVDVPQEGDDNVRICINIISNVDILTHICIPWHFSVCIILTLLSKIFLISQCILLFSQPNEVLLKFKFDYDILSVANLSRHLFLTKLRFKEMCVISCYFVTAAWKRIMKMQEYVKLDRRTELLHQPLQSETWIFQITGSNSVIPWFHDAELFLAVLSNNSARVINIGHEFIKGVQTKAWNWSDF